MPTLTTEKPETFAELWKRLGDVPPERIRMVPAPGTAVPADVLPLCEGTPKRLCELVDGVLVEKAVGHRESRLAAWLLHFLINYLEQNDLGIIAGADGPYHLRDDLVRLLDISFTAYGRIPEGADPNTPMPDWIPNLAVEILSPGNTPSEMARKRQDYFDAGVELVWFVDADSKIVQVYTSADDCVTLTEDDQLDGAQLLPGFSVSIRQWFAKALPVRP